MKAGLQDEAGVQPQNKPPKARTATATYLHAMLWLGVLVRISYQEKFFSN